MGRGDGRARLGMVRCSVVEVCQCIFACNSRISEGPSHVFVTSICVRWCSGVYDIRDGCVLEAALCNSRRCRGSATGKLGWENDEGWLRPWTTGRTPLTVDQIIRTARLLGGFIMLQISPFPLHANALFRLLGYLLRARWINTASMHLPIDCSSSCDDPSSLVERAMRLCHCRNFTHSRCHQHAVIYTATTKHLICIVSRRVADNMASIETLPFLLSSLHTGTFPQPFDTAGAQCHAARPISAGLPALPCLGPRRRLMHVAHAAGSLAAASPPWVNYSAAAA